MSSNFVYGAIGAVAGFFISGGNPMGAIYGWAIGSMAGALLNPPEMQGPRLDDLKAQASTYGWPIPLVYGVNRQAGNVIWQPDLIEVATEEDAKGGPSVTSFTYFAHAAVLLCRGPIAGVRRIWANKRLIYDVRSTNTGEIKDPVIGALRIYLGDETQTPDPLIVAHQGDSPAYRGWAYVVFESLGLSEHFGNRLPLLEFEIVENGSSAIPDAQEIGTQVSGRHHMIASDTGEFWSCQGVAGSPQICRVIVSQPATLQELATIDQPESGAAGGILTQWMLEVGNEAWVINGGFSLDAIMVFNRTTRTYVGSFNPSWSSFTGGAHYDSFTGHVFAWTVNVADVVHVLNPTTREVTSSFNCPGSGALSHIISVQSVFGPGIAVLAPSAVHLYPPAVNYTGVEPDFSFDESVGFPSNQGWPGSRLAYDASRGNLVVFGNVGNNKKIVVINLMESTLTVVDWEPTFGERFTCNRAGVYHPGRDKYYVGGIDHDLPFGTSARQVLELDPVTLLPIRAIVHDDDIITEAMDDLYVPKGSNQYLVWAGGIGVPAKAWKFPLEPLLDPADRSLGHIVRDIGTQCGMVPADDLNVTALDAVPVKGYTIGRQMTGRAAIEPLQTAFFFDMVESDDKLKAVVRGGAIATTIPEDERGAHEPGGEQPASVEITRLQELETPSQLEVRFPDLNRDYEVSSVYDRRLVRASKNQATLDLAIVMDALKASQVAAVNLYLAWQRARFNWKTSRKWTKYEPTDVVTLPTPAGSYSVRITGKREHPNGLIEWEGALEDGAIYSQNGVASAVSNYPGQTIIAPGSAVMQLMDIPILRDEDNEAGFYAAYSTTGTAQGCSLYRSSDGVAYTLIKQMTSESVMGSAVGALGAGSKGNIFDHALTVDVVLTEGELASDTQLNVLNGANLALLGSEVIQFKTATLLSPKTYRLSGLLRGRFGTEWARAGHVAGERFVLVDQLTWRRILSDVSLIGLLRFYKAPLFGASLAGTPAQQFTNNAVGLEPYAGCSLRGARDGSNNLTITWKRRTRIGGAWRDLVDVPLGETSESYEVEIWDAGFTTLKRTIAGLTTPSASYTAAQQTTDFGSPQAQVATRAYQLSSVVGRGYKLEGTV